MFLGALFTTLTSILHQKNITNCQCRKQTLFADYLDWNNRKLGNWANYKQQSARQITERLQMLREMLI